MCYHGFSIDDQHKFEDILFIRKETFDRRMKIVKKWNFKVCTLSEAVEKLPGDHQPNNSLVITFDDGWASTVQALPSLRMHNFPATLYVSTYYALKEANVFNVLLRYMFWKTTASSLKLKNWSSSLDGNHDLSDSNYKSLLLEEIIEFGDNQSLNARNLIIEKLALQLGINLESINSQRMFKYLSVSELKEIRKHGIALELHTHRHDFPTDEKLAEREISQNREILGENMGVHCEHFCYPSGIYSPLQFPLLREMKIKSATTTTNGLNSSTTSLYELNRFLDREKISDLEFEAEICGVVPLLKTVLKPRSSSRGIEIDSLPQLEKI